MESVFPLMKPASLLVCLTLLAAFAAAEDYVPKRPTAREIETWERLVAADVDHDGVISEGELEAAVTQLGADAAPLRDAKGEIDREKIERILNDLRLCPPVPTPSDTRYDCDLRQLARFTSTIRRLRIKEEPFFYEVKRGDEPWFLIGIELPEELLKGEHEIIGDEAIQEALAVLTRVTIDGVACHLPSEAALAAAKAEPVPEMFIIPRRVAPLEYEPMQLPGIRFDSSRDLHRTVRFRSTLRRVPAKGFRYAAQLDGVTWYIDELLPTELLEGEHEIVADERIKWNMPLLYSPTIDGVHYQPGESRTVR
jgi:hypothetical protein